MPGRVVITGASGLLGGNLAAVLAAEGHHVVATRRSSTKVDHLADLPVQPRHGLGTLEHRRFARG